MTAAALRSNWRRVRILAQNLGVNNRTDPHRNSQQLGPQQCTQCTRTWMIIVMYNVMYIVMYIVMYMVRIGTRTRSL